MAVKYMDFLWNFDNFSLFRLGTVTQGFLKSLITNLKSESQNSKWWIILLISCLFFRSDYVI